MDKYEEHPEDLANLGGLMVDDLKSSRPDDGTTAPPSAAARLRGA